MRHFLAHNPEAYQSVEQGRYPGSKTAKRSPTAIQRDQEKPLERGAQEDPVSPALRAEALLALNWDIKR
jgi:hypothetical protein